MKFFIATLVLLLTSLWANAEKLEKKVEESNKGKKIILYKKKTSVDFTDAVIEGRVENPEGMYVVRPPDKEFGSLLKLRPNFHKELLRDSLLLK